MSRVVCLGPYKGGLAETGGSSNNDKLAKCQGKRVVSCNEAFGEGDAEAQFEPRQIKTLIGLDDPVETMQKYKAPLEWRGQALLILSTNTLPQMPNDDGGLMSRISLVRFPFEFIPKPRTEEGRSRRTCRSIHRSPRRVGRTRPSSPRS